MAESALVELEIRRMVLQAADVSGNSRVAFYQRWGYSPTQSATQFFASYSPQPLIDDCVAMEKPLGVAEAGAGQLDTVPGLSDRARLEAHQGGGRSADSQPTAAVSGFVARRRLERGLSGGSTTAGAMVMLAAAASSPPGNAFIARRATAQVSSPPVTSSNHEPTPEKSSAARATIEPRSRIVGTLQLPSIAVRPRDSALSRASRHYAATRAAVLAGGGEPDMQLRADIVAVMAVGAAIDEVVELGVNANTNTKDERAWLFWEHVCEQQGTSPLRTAQDVRDHPERQSHLLAALLMYAFAVCRPTDKARAFIKPRSALAYPLAIVRIFGRWGITMPGYKAVVAALNGLMRAYLLYHGPYSLAPKRAEPMRFSMVHDMNQIASGAQVGNMVWNHDDHDVFSFRMLSIFLMFTAFRLAELVSHASGEIMYITRDAITWHIAGMVLTDPSPDQLGAMRPGLDFARCRVPRSKPDQWGEIHCPFPVTLTYYEEPENAAAALRAIEIRRPCHGDARPTTPLFADASGEPYTHARLARILRCALTFLYGAAKVDVLQAGNTPQVDADWGYATLVQGINGPMAREAQRDYEAALRAATNPTPATANVAAAAVPRRSTSHAVSGHSRKQVQTTPVPPQAAPSLKALDSAPRVGDSVFVPRECWPSYPCNEFAGEGWAATVQSKTRYTATVSFDYNHTSRGAPYADERLDWMVLKGFA